MGGASKTTERFSLYEDSADTYKLHTAAMDPNYKVQPVIDYSSVAAVKGPLVILDNVKLPKYSEIVNLTLKNGEKRTGQVLEINGKQAIVQVSFCFTFTLFGLSFCFLLIGGDDDVASALGCSMMHMSVSQIT